MHVTLAFLGEQPAARLDVLARIGAAAASASRRGALSLASAGSFGGKRSPRVLWVGLGGDLEALRGLQERLSERLRQEHFPVEEREFSPHVTLARRRQNATGGAPSGWPPNVEHQRFEMDELTLFESKLSPKGALYTPVGKFELGG